MPLYDVDTCIMLQYNAVEQIEAESEQEAMQKLHKLTDSYLFHLATQTGVGIRAKVNAITVTEVRP